MPTVAQSRPLLTSVSYFLLLRLFCSFFLGGDPAFPRNINSTDSDLVNSQSLMRWHNVLIGRFHTCRHPIQLCHDARRGASYQVRIVVSIYQILRDLWLLHYFNLRCIPPNGANF